MGMIKILIGDIEPESAEVVVAAIQMAVTMAAPDASFEANIFNTDGTPYQPPEETEEFEAEA